MTPSFSFTDKDTADYSSAASAKQGDILTAMGVPWLDPHSCDPMFSMLHPATSTSPSVGLIPPSAISTPTTASTSNTSSGINTPSHIQHHPHHHQHPSDIFWQPPTNGTLPIYAAPVSPSNSQQMAHRRSMPEIKQPYQHPSSANTNTSSTSRRQRRRTEGTIIVDDGDDEQRRQMFLERNRQGSRRNRVYVYPFHQHALSCSCIQVSLTQKTMAYQFTESGGIHGY